MAFLSKYDENIIEGMNIREEINEYLKIDWLENHKFGEPLNNDNIDFCIKAIFKTIAFLSSHFLQNGDLKKAEYNNFNVGYNRRLQTLFEVNKPKYKGKRLFYEIGLKLNNIINDLSERHLIKPINDDLRYLSNEYLSNLAFEIDNDLRKTFEDCKKNPQFEYKGK